MDRASCAALTELIAPATRCEAILFTRRTFGFVYVLRDTTVRLGVSEYAGAMRDKLRLREQMETWLTAKDIQAPCWMCGFQRQRFI